jgi:hypothetical protein
MSQIKQYPITCPDCGFVDERVLFTSLNGERVPAQIPHLLDDTFEEQVCAQCGLCFRPEHEMLYSNFGQRAWVVMMPPAARPRHAALEEALLAQFASAFATAPPPLVAALAEVKPRLVFGQVMLSEAVRTVELGLEPALLECAKLFTWRRNLARLMALGPHELTFRGFAGEAGPDGGLLLAVRRLADGQILDELVMPARVLEEVSEVRAELLSQYPDLFSRPYVSATRYLFGAGEPAATEPA